MKKAIEGLHCAQLSNGYWVNINYNISGVKADTADKVVQETEKTANNLAMQGVL